MAKDIEILKKYYDEIKRNIDQSVSADVFAAKCVGDYKEKIKRKKIEARNNEKLDCLREKRERANILLVRKETAAKLKKNRLKLKRLGEQSYKGLNKNTQEGKMESFNALIAMIDILRE
ncbi:hypothetical protein [Labilibaculum euxinus]